MRRDLLAAAVLLILAAMALLVTTWPVRPRPLAHVQGKVLSPPTGDEGWVAWLDGDPDEGRLVAARRPGATARVILTGAGLSGLAVAGHAAFLTRTEEPASGNPRTSLLRVDLRDGASQMLAEVPRGADETVSGEGWLCWREDREAALPEVPFVVAAAPLTAVRACPEAADDIRTLAVITGEASPAAAHVELLGIVRQNAYWLERSGVGRSASTVIRRAALPDGQPEAVVREQGRRSAVLTEDALLWTAPSLEAAAPSQSAAVKRRPFGESDAKVIADWLSPDGVLLASHGGVYVQERYRLWRLGGERGRQRVLFEGPGGVVTGRVLGDQQYLVMRSGRPVVVATRPLTWWARARALLRR